MNSEKIQQAIRELDKISESCTSANSSNEIDEAIKHLKEAKKLEAEYEE